MLYSHHAAQGIDAYGKYWENRGWSDRISSPAKALLLGMYYHQNGQCAAVCITFAVDLHQQPIVYLWNCNIFLGAATLLSIRGFDPQSESLAKSFSLLTDCLVAASRCHGILPQEMSRIIRQTLRFLCWHHDQSHRDFWVSSPREKCLLEELLNSTTRSLISTRNL